MNLATPAASTVDSKKDKITAKLAIKIIGKVFCRRIGPFRDPLAKVPTTKKLLQTLEVLKVEGVSFTVVEFDLMTRTVTEATPGKNLASSGKNDQVIAQLTHTCCRGTYTK